MGQGVDKRCSPPHGVMPPRCHPASGVLPPPGCFSPRTSHGGLQRGRGTCRALSGGQERAGVGCPPGAGGPYFCPPVPELMAFVPTAGAPSSAQPCAGAGRRSNPSPGFEPVAGEISPFPGCSRQETCAPYLAERSNCCHCPVRRQGSGSRGGGEHPPGPPALQGEAVLASGGKGE